MAFLLHASEISDKSEMEEKIMFQSQPNRHISSRSKKFCTSGAKMWRFSGRMWQKTSQVKIIYFRVRERHILPRNVTTVTRHIFCHRKKWQMWHHSPKSETWSWEEIRARPTLDWQRGGRGISSLATHHVEPYILIWIFWFKLTWIDVDFITSLQIV